EARVASVDDPGKKLVEFQRHRSYPVSLVREGSYRQFIDWLTPSVCSFESPPACSLTFSLCESPFLRFRHTRLIGTEEPWAGRPSPTTRTRPNRLPDRPVPANLLRRARRARRPTRLVR